MFPSSSVDDLASFLPDAQELLRPTGENGLAAAGYTPEERV